MCDPSDGQPDDREQLRVRVLELERALEAIGGVVNEFHPGGAPRD